MKEIAEKSIYKNLKKSAILCLKITIVLGVFFSIFFGQLTVKSFLTSIAVAGLYSFVLGFGQGLINELLTQKWNWVTQTNKRVWAGIIATVIYTIPTVLAIDYIIFIKLSKVPKEDFFSDHFIWAHLFYIILSFGVSAFLHARSFMLSWKKAVTLEKVEYQMTAKSETAKFETLKSQINPHFLFNSLNVLSSLIEENPNKAEQFTAKLSKIYRYVLEQQNKELVLLSEELEFAQNYIDLLQMRFEETLQFNFPKITNNDLKIVPLSLQLLLENAVKHNAISTKKPLQISIEEVNGYLKISNNINPKEIIEKSTKLGLQNIANRYGLVTSKNILIENNKKTFTVKIPLLKTSEKMKKETQNLENIKYVRAVEKVEKLKDFYQNVAAYCIIIPFLIFINLKTSPHYHWFWFPLAGWGVGIIFHALEVYGYNPFLGKNWEERKIKEFMDNDKE